MTHRALLFDGLDSFADIAAAQCRAFNDAFGEGGLNWLWDAPTCESLAHIADGETRIRHHAAQIGETLSSLEIRRLDRAMVRHFTVRAARHGVPVRPGVGYRIARARDAGARIGLVTDHPLAPAVIAHNTLGLRFDAVGPHKASVLQSLRSRDYTMVTDQTELDVLHTV